MVNIEYSYVKSMIIVMVMLMILTPFFLFFIFYVAKKVIHQKNGQWSVCLILA